jgi:diguanylate cyclase (GGDEF)-like protein
MSWTIPQYLGRGRPKLLAMRFAVAATLFVVLATVIASAFVGSWAVDAVDRTALERQIRFATRGIAERFASIPTEQESSAIWDEAVSRVKQNDQPWIEENLGVWMGSYFGHERAYVLNEYDDPIYAMRSEKTLPPTTYEEDRPIVAPLVEEVRAAMAEASAGEEDSTEAIKELGAEDYVRLAGRPAIVSVKPIIPSSAAMTQKPRSEYLHVVVEMVDDSFAGAIARQYDLTNAGISATPDGAPSAVPIVTLKGETLAYLKWDRYRPGSTLAEGVAPILLLASLPIAALLLLLLRQVWSSAAALERSEREARFQAFHDSLTGLPNRALFDDRLEQAIKVATRCGTKLGVLLIDIDRFKQINDTQGHPAGDELVREIGTRLVGLVRAADTVARLGGDEFGVLMPDLETERDAERCAERILKRTQESFNLSGEQTFISVSIGVLVSPGEGLKKADALRKADIALYEAKAKGRRRYSLFADGMDEVLRQRRAVERDLHSALESGDQLAVQYQPLFDSGGRTIAGAEALVRWNHPVHGELSPSVFIGIAEERGLIEPLGEWVLEQACRTAVDTGLPWIAVNVSPIQLHADAFADKVLSILERVNLPPHCLQIEITEGTLLEDDRLVDVALTRLRNEGIQVALDDFGTGYASISHLRRYPVDKIKIDKSFVTHLGSTPDADAIVRAIVALGRAMKKTVAAEGVETIDQRDHLAALGCHELQGFLLSAPLSKDQLAGALKGTNVAMWVERGKRRVDRPASLSA